MLQVLVGASAVPYAMSNIKVRPATAGGRLRATLHMDISMERVLELQKHGFLPPGDPVVAFLDAVEDRLREENRRWNRAVKSKRRL